MAHVWLLILIVFQTGQNVFCQEDFQQFQSLVLNEIKLLKEDNIVLKAENEELKKDNRDLKFTFCQL